MPVHESGLKKTNFSLIHAIRGVAAFYVIIFHAKFVLWSGGQEFMNKFPRESWTILDYLNVGLTLLFNSGQQMVMIFFVLSGFFIAMSLNDSNLSFTAKLKRFYTIRAIRIYAPYLASIALAVLVFYCIRIFSPELFSIQSNRELNHRLIIANENLTFYNFLKSLLFLYDKEYIGLNAVYWSLLYEGIFYLVVPFVDQLKKRYLQASVFLYGCGVITFSIFENWNPLLKYFLEFNFYFAIGYAIYIYRNDITAFLKNKLIKRKLILLGGLLFLMFDVLAILRLDIWANLMAAIAGGLFLIIFLNYDFRDTWLIKYIKYLGKISYSLYLVHFPVLILVYAIFFHFSGHIIFYGYEYLVGIFLSLIMGVLLYRTVEEPSMVVIKKIKKAFSSQGVKQTLNVPVSLNKQV